MGKADKAVSMSWDEIDSIVESFKQQDFLGSTKAYDWMYENFGASGLMTNQVSIKMSQAAKKIGIRNFKAMWREYIKEKGVQAKEVKRLAPENSTNFSNQPLDLKCGGYEATDGGVVVDGPYGLIDVCSHPIMPVRRLVNIDTGDNKYVISWTRNCGKNWREAIYDMNTLMSARNIVALSSQGVDVTSESSKELVKYISYIANANYGIIPQTKTVGRLGWIEGHGFSPFIKGLQYDCGGQFTSEFASVTCKGSEEVWMGLAKTVRAGKSVPARIALATAFASPLVHLLNGLPSITHLWGSVSGIGKSVGLKLAASVWANPEIGRYIKTTKATEVAMEQQAAFCGNLPMIMDELQLIQNNKDFDRIIYSICEGSGKSRGSKYGGLQTQTHWCNTILTSGEQPITTANSKAGAVNRVIEVECSEKLFDDPRNVSQIVDNNYGFAGKRFVQILAGMDGEQDNPFWDDGDRVTASDEAMAHLREVHEKVYQELQGTGATDKQILTASILLTAEALTEEWLFKDGHALTVDDLRPFLLTQVQADTNRRAYTWLMDWVGMNVLHFEVVSDDQVRHDPWGRLSQENGYPASGGNAYYCDILTSKFNDALTERGFSPGSFESWARKKGIIKVDKFGRNVQVNNLIPGVSKTRCVRLRLNYEFDDDEKSGQIIENMTEVHEQLPF